jgi:hypothetical protein
MVIMFHFFRAFRGQPHLAQLSVTLFGAVEDLIHFVLLFLVLFVNFAFAGLVLWGSQLHAWSTAERALYSTFKAMLGDIDLDSMYKVSPVATLTWFWFFYTIMVMLLLNFLLAMTFDHYRMVKSRAGSRLGLIAQLKYAGKGAWYKGFDFVDKIRRLWNPDRNEPSRGEAIQKLLEICGYSESECQSAMTSSLGAKLIRKERERLVFAGSVLPETTALASSNAAGDMKDMGFDQDYVDWIQKEAVHYSERELDMEEMRESQLRELVALAEAEMSMMRDRLAFLRQRGGQRFTFMEEQMESLEKAVHGSLGELAGIAHDAGVPDGSGLGDHIPARAMDSFGCLGGDKALADYADDVQNAGIERVLYHYAPVIQERVDAAPPGQDAMAPWTQASRAVQQRNKSATRLYGKPS